MNIQVLEIRPDDRGGAVKAKVDVRFHGLDIFDVKVMNTGAELWVSLPATAWEDATGKRRWRQHVKFADKAVQKQVERIVLDAWKPKVVEAEPFYDDPIPF